MKHMISSSCPIAQRTTEKFCQVQIFDGKRAAVPFEREVIWLLESQSKVVFTHGGEVFKEGTTYNDFYGYLTSAEQARHLEKINERYKITPQSSLETRLVTEVYLSPRLESEMTKKLNITDPLGNFVRYDAIPDEWRQKSIKDGQKLYVQIQSKELAKEITYSSKLSKEQNAMNLSRFQAKWSLESVKAMLDPGSHAEPATPSCN